MSYLQSCERCKKTVQYPYFDKNKNIINWPLKSKMIKQSIQTKFTDLKKQLSVCWFKINIKENSFAKLKEQMVDVDIIY